MLSVLFLCLLKEFFALLFLLLVGRDGLASVNFVEVENDALALLVKFFQITDLVVEKSFQVFGLASLKLP